MAVDANGLEILSTAECLDLLREHPSRLGRVGLSVDGGPLVLPVNYELDGDDVVFRTGPGNKLAAAVTPQAIAFEVDDVDRSWKEGWSVLVRGVCVLVTDPVERNHLRTLHLHPWAGGDKSHWIRIRASEVTGRRIR